MRKYLIKPYFRNLSEFTKYRNQFIHTPSTFLLGAERDDSDYRLWNFTDRRPRDRKIPFFYKDFRNDGDTFVGL